MCWKWIGTGFKAAADNCPRGECGNWFWGSLRAGKLLTRAVDVQSTSIFVIIGPL